MDASIQYGHFQMLKSNGLNNVMLLCDVVKVQFLSTACTQSFRYNVLIIKDEFLENPSSTLLGFSRISNLFQAHWDFLEIA